MVAQKPRGLITEANQEEADYLTKNLDTVLELEIVAETLANAHFEHLNEIEVLIPFIHTKIGLSELEMMPKLRLIATRSTGYDHNDLAAAKARDILVSNVPAYGETAVAEFTFALMLTLSRKVHQAYARTQRGDYTLEGPSLLLQHFLRSTKEILCSLGYRSTFKAHLPGDIPEDCGNLTCSRWIKNLFYPHEWAI